MTGYAPCWPFRVKSKDGDEWESDMNPVIEFIWNYLFSFLWDGTIKVINK